MTTSNRVACALALGLFLLPPAARAQPSGQQPSAADLESARELYKEAKQLRDSGDLRGALDKFKQAHAYGQTPVTALELGRTHMMLGELIEAREMLLSVGRMKVQPDETEKSASARQEAADLAEQIRPKIPTLDIKVTGAPADATAQLSVDGVALPVVSQSAVRKVNPGAHVVVAKAAGREAKVDVNVAEGETKAVVVPLEQATPVATGGPPTTGGPQQVSGGETTTTSTRHSPGTLTWVGLGVGGAGLVVGGITGLIAMNKASKVKGECSGLSCPKSAQNDVTNGRTMATISTIGFAVGAAGLALAAIDWFVLSPKRTEKADGPHIRAVASGTFVGLDGAF